MNTVIDPPDAKAKPHTGWLRRRGTSWRPVVQGDSYEQAFTRLLDFSRRTPGGNDLMVLAVGDRPPALRIKDAASEPAGTRER
jgi:hypothetical protein